jgi:hypothetical protein
MNESDHLSVWLNFINIDMNNIHVINLFRGIEFHPCCQCHSHDHVFFYINIVHCTLLMPIISSTFIHVLQFHPCHLLSIMLSISSKWQGSSLWSNFIHVIKFIQMVIQNLHVSHMYNLISFMAISYWHRCHPYGKKWFPVNSIQFPLFMKWTIFFSLFHHGQCQGFFIHNQIGNHP